MKQTYGLEILIIFLLILAGVFGLVMIYIPTFFGLALFVDAFIIIFLIPFVFYSWWKAGKIIKKLSEKTSQKRENPIDTNEFLNKLGTELKKLKWNVKKNYKFENVEVLDLMASKEWGPLHDNIHFFVKRYNKIDKENLKEVTELAKKLSPKKFLKITYTVDLFLVLADSVSPKIGHGIEGMMPFGPYTWTKNALPSITISALDLSSGIFYGSKKYFLEKIKDKYIAGAEIRDIVIKVLQTL